MSTSINWIPKLRKQISELNEIPLFGKGASFDLETFADELSKVLGIDCKIQIDRFQKSSSTPSHALRVEVQPLKTVYWEMDLENQKKLIDSLMKPSSSKPLPLSESIEQGFYTFTLLKALEVLQKMEPFSEFTLKISEENSSFKKGVAANVKLLIQDKTLWAKIYVPDTFQNEWTEHFSKFASDFIPEKKARKIPLELSLNIGSIDLSEKEIETLSLGDFLCLDELFEQKHKRTCVLMAKDVPLFLAEIQNNKLKLIDYAIDVKESSSKVRVSMGQIQMNLDQLMQLEKGSTIDLPIHPDHNVQLMMGEKQIAKAEIIYLAEQPGARILEL